NPCSTCSANQSGSLRCRPRSAANAARVGYARQPTSSPTPTTPPSSVAASASAGVVTHAHASGRGSATFPAWISTGPRFAVGQVRLISHEELTGPLAGYRLIERLGRGGFGEVWKVEAPGGLHKAMKFVFGDLDAADEDGRPAEQELKALHRVKQIRHPYILSLERFDIIDGHLIIVM